ncbi:cysteine-rich receptor-like protein kinase 25 [Malania oleifera]|uniref:cysteine-rich receptor-like protein kinase 25 n=1 Tax=Malania oleifera TaxID=397392 RepID=UPI0025ADB84C|nr:cysteine-rich receptor-like protein kinase 25 [Malania oleifera]
MRRPVMFNSKSVNPKVLQEVGSPCPFGHRDPILTPWLLHSPRCHLPLLLPSPHPPLCFFFCPFFSSSPAPNPTYVYQICGSDRKNATEFSPNSTYQSNLNSLLSSLYSSNSTRNRPFRNLTVAGRPNGSASATVYGLSLCRGDVTTDVCQECVAGAGPYVVRTCARVRSAVIWFEECLVRYSDRYIFSTSDQEPNIAMLNTGNITEPNRFAQLLADTMSKIVTRAATDRTPPEKFATAEAAFSGFQKLYTLAQCTPDLSSSDCNRCLQVATSTLPSCCGGKPTIEGSSSRDHWLCR